MPVYDLGWRLGVNFELNEHSKIVIIQTGSEATGVIVDEVDGVLTVDHEQVEPAHGADTTLIEAIAKVGERLIVLLAPAAIFGVELAAAGGRM